MAIARSFLPRLSVYDPAEASEGSLDPLGFAQLADKLAEKLVPAYTERSRRPRFLTAVALGARVLDRPNHPDGVYGDHEQGPANIAFERLLVEAFARRGEPGEAGLLGVQGIGKARDAAGKRVRLTSRIYLVAPAAVGLWAAYKRLARELRVIDDSGHLLENGFELLRAWEGGIGRPGLVTGTGESTMQLLSEIDRALEPLLDDAGEGWNPQKVWDFLYEYLRPDAMTTPEAKVLRRLLVDMDAARSDVFTTIESRWKGLADLLDIAEPEVLRVLGSNGARPTQRIVAAILAYERVVVLALEAFEAMRLASGSRTGGRIDAAFVLESPTSGDPLRRASNELKTALDVAERRLDELDLSDRPRETLAWLREGALSSPEALFNVLLRHHFETQRRKPPHGKRPWIEGDENGYFVRTHYALTGLPPRRTTFHSYRTASVRTTLRDLWRAES